MTEAMDRAATAYPVFYRTYSRKIDGSREHWHETCNRTLKGLRELGKLTQEQSDLINEMQLGLKALTSGRWLWVGGTEWSKKQANHYGSYNCTSTLVVDWQAFGLMMNLAMQGCGTGAVLETQYIEQLPEIRNRLNVEIQGKVGDKPHFSRKEQTHILIDHRWNEVLIEVGDSREGWVKSYEELLRLSSDKQFDSNFVVNVTVDVTNVRPSGEVLKGFGGVANPIKLEGLYSRCAEILNRAVGRKLNAVECCLLIDEAALVVVAGNVRRCLPKGALVHTESGLVPIEKVRIGDRVLTSKGYYPVTNFFVQGEQPLCRIETEDGFLECTADHKVAVLSDVFGEYKMIKAKDLAQGDRLVFVPTSIKGLPTELPENRFVSTGKTKHIQVPALTADVAYFLGYFHGNGSVSTDGNRIRVTVPVGWNVIVDRLVLVANQFGISDYKLSDLTKNNVQAVELAFNSVALNHYFGQFKQAYQSPVIPDCILQGTENIRKAYLSGLADADGCHSQAVLVASNYRSFLLKVQTLYASLGVTTRVCQSIRKSTGRWEGELVTVGEHAFDSVSEWFDSYSLKWAVQKKERPKSFKDHGFPKDMVRPLVSSYLYGWGSTQKQMIVPTVKKFVKTATELIPVAVKSVVFDVDVLETFDIEVASIHEFVCNGLLVSNSAGMRQFSENDKLAEVAKDNLWQQSEDGSWRIDPERDALRMANHTRVFHHKPSLNECIASVTKQYYSGEGAIQYAPEAIARANADLLTTTADKHQFLKLYEQGIDVAKHWLAEMFPSLTERELVHRLQRYGLNPCGEIIGSNFFCNLAEIHLNQIDPLDIKSQRKAFTAGGLSVAVLLNHQFVDRRYQESREADPIVGVSFTGLFDFFVNAFGVDWLRWWEAGRPKGWGNDCDKVYALINKIPAPVLDPVILGHGNVEWTLSDIFELTEVCYLAQWKEAATKAVTDYCLEHGLKAPNRCTTVQPSGSKSLLTGASPGWHPPKAQRFIRRITFRKNDPVALACIDYGYSVVPSQSDKDENGNLLNDPFDPRCTEWLVEIPVEVPWANLEGADSIDISKFSALAQFDFYMQVQRYYTTHNTSSTIELRSDEIEPLATAIYETIRDDGGYISSALLARFDDLQTYPRMPFEPIDKHTYDRLFAEMLLRRKVLDFHEALLTHDEGLAIAEAGPAGCDSDKCLIGGNNNK